MAEPNTIPRHRHWGRRKRRLRRAGWLLAAAAAAGIAAGVWIYRATRPEVYRPGEDHAEITQNLSRGLPADAPAPRFADATGEAGLTGFRTFAGVRSSQLPEDMGSGAAWGDFDRDGDDDLFLVAAGGPLTGDPTTWAPSALYENLAADGRPGAFRRSAAFPELRVIGMAAAWGDADGDGWLDLVVTGYDTLMLFRNREGRLARDQSFPPLATGMEGFWAGAVWGDVDNDRDLDLYVTGYVRYVEDPSAREQVSQQYGHAVPYTLNPISFDPERNLLFRNRSDGTFDEVAEELGIANPEGRSLGALWHDFDDDGRLDLYVANDVSDNAFYLNREDGFEDAGLAAWVADYRGAMGLAAGDWNRDGDDDLFVTHWIAQENALYDSLLADVRARDAAGPAGPALPAGIGFSDLAAPLGLGQIALRFVGWGTEFVDLDADGWLDLVVANGSTFERRDDPTRLDPQEPQLLWNRRGEHFHDLAPGNEALSAPHVGRGLAVADYDLDGDPDLAIVQLGEGVQLLRNDMAAGRSVSLKLVSRTAAGELLGSGDGARVIARVGDAVLRRTVGGASYLSQSSRTLHLGLGEAERVDELEVRWLGGGTDVYRGIEAGAVWELREKEAEPRRLRGFADRDGRRVGLGSPEGGGTRPTEGRGETAEDPLPTDPRERTLAFWRAHRAGMDAIKKEGDPGKAEGHFRRALALDPAHEDARYYLAAALVARGETPEALEHLRELARRSPRSHRAFKRWGTLEALAATSPAELEEASRALERALELNQEETGSLLVLGELALMQGEPALAAQRLEWACRTNPKAVGGFFLRGYVAWKNGDAKAAAALLDQTRQALGPEWKPQGMVSEGDTTRTMHEDETPLARFWRAWDGQPDPDSAFAALDDFLTRFQR
ncbi:MAG TPA: FG-GAP-like repeat-containing protein [Thermoanaerobaculia bacterium]|nr:FG-GAP-like repeat-containing protein [Thermoanaerobaculia bacterium]